MSATIENFKQAMRSAGIEPPPEIIADGKLHRFTVADDKPRSENGWYIFHNGDLPAGAFGCWKRQVNETWNGREYRSLTADEKTCHNANMEAIKRQREQAQREVGAACIAKAESMLKAAGDVKANHAYLVRKNIKPYESRQLKDMLLIPVRKEKTLTGLQIIMPDGSKKFLTGTGKTGAYLAIPGTGKTVYLCEGWATGCTIHELTGAPVIVCFDCGNLEPVATAVKKVGPEYDFVIVADNDRLTDGNLGLTKATAAALTISARLAIPTFPGDDGTDVNDLYSISGKEAALSCLQDAITPEPIQTPAPDSATVTDNPLTAAVDRLAKLSPLEYDRVRKDEAKALGVRPGTLDAAVKAAKKQEESADTPFHEVEPWPEPVDGAVLLATLVSTIRRFIICEPHTAIAAALWIVMSWFMEVVQVAPLALITAPEKRCGKTLFLSLIGKLVPRALTSSSITPSALFRSIDLWKPTLLIDETDACLKDNEELRGLINSGHTRDSAYTIRCVGDDHTPTKFNTWGAKALSGIGHVADTLMDRAVIFELRRKLPNESVDSIRHTKPELFSELCQKLARFADDNAEAVRAARPILPPSLNDRAQDNWEPLLAIAVVAGGDWYKTGTAAAVKLSGGETVSPTIGAELLADIQEIFQHNKIDRVSTTDLIKFLVTDDEKPWAGYNRGFQIKPRQIAAKLKGYGIHSKTVRINGTETAKGFEIDQFSEAFSRYIPITPPEKVTESQSLIPQGLRDISISNTEPSVTFRKTCEPASTLTCDLVTDRIPLNGNEEVFDLTGTTFEVMP